MILKLLPTLLLLVPTAALAESPFQRSVWHPELTDLKLTESEAVVGNAVLDQLRRSEPLLDAPLVDAARLYAARDGEPGDALIAAGVSDAYVVPIRFVVRGKDVLRPVRELLRSRIDAEGMTHFGVGVAKGPDREPESRTVALLFVRRGAEMGRFPKSLSVGERFLLNGRLAAGLDSARVLVASPEGRVYEVEPRARGHLFWSTLRFVDGPGRYAVEVQARDRFGTQVLNLLDVHVGEAGKAPEVPTLRLRPAALSVRSAVEAEKRSLMLLNHTRQSMGLPPLQLSLLLADEAQQHSADMAKASFFGHKSPTRGGLGDRLGRAEVVHTLALENIAMGPSPDSVHADLVRSPSHLRNILDPDVTHVGVGVFQETGGPEPVYVITQIFARFR